MSRTLTFPRNRAVVALFIRDVTSRFDLGQQVSLRPASSYVCVCVPLPSAWASVEGGKRNRAVMTARVPEGAVEWGVCI